MTLRNQTNNPLPLVALLMASLALPVTADTKQLPDPDGKPADMSKKIKVFILSGQSNMCGMGKVDPLKTLVQNDKNYSYLVDGNGGWTQRKDAYFLYSLMGVKLHAKGWVSATVNGNRIGPEGAIGHYMGHHLDEPVLLIKVACGNRSLGFDVMPPTSRKRTGNTDNSKKYYHGWSYDNWVKGAKDLLGNLKTHYPGYQGKGYEVAGFFWWQGHKDKGMGQEEHEALLKDLINDFRTEFAAPRAPFVVATIGFNGQNTGPWTGVFNAQMAISDPSRHPEFAGNVSSVDIRSFGGGGTHYGDNGATYTKVGDAMGRAMVGLLSTQAKSGKTTDKATSNGKANAALEKQASAKLQTVKRFLKRTNLTSKQKQLARKHLELIIKKYPDTESANEARSLLETNAGE